jgi:hypothetical protein
MRSSWNRWRAVSGSSGHRPAPILRITFSFGGSGSTSPPLHGVRRDVLKARRQVLRARVIPTEGIDHVVRNQKLKTAADEVANACICRGPKTLKTRKESAYPPHLYTSSVAHQTLLMHEPQRGYARNGNIMSVPVLEKFSA